MSSPFFIGTTRFSLFIPGSISWNLSTRFEGLEEYQRALYSDLRLAPRLDIFANRALPQLALAAQGHNVKHFVQISSTLPASYKAELYRLAEMYDFLEIFCSDSYTEHSTLVDRVALGWAGERADNSHFAWYRVDDDDIIGKNYFSMAMKYIGAPFEGMVLSFGRGYTGVYHAGEIWDLREFYNRTTSAGQMYIGRVDSESQCLIEPPRKNHALIDRWAPLIVDSRTPNFLTMRHPLQDGHLNGILANSLHHIFGDQSKLPMAIPDEVFEENFPILAKEIKSSMTNEYGVENSLIEGPLQVSFEKQLLSIPDSEKGIEIEFYIEICPKPAEGRVLIGLEFEDGIPTDVKSLENGWSELSDTTLVTRHSAADRIEKRFHLLDEMVRFKPKISIWHSKHLVDSSVTIKKFTYRS